MKYYTYHQGTLQFRTGRVVICDACFHSRAMFTVAPGTIGEFYFVDEPGSSESGYEIAPGIKVGDLVALEIRFLDTTNTTTIKKIGCVGVDSAQIIVADELDLFDCVPDPLFITAEFSSEVAQNLILAHSLETRRLSKDWIEILADERESLHRMLCDYILCNKLGDPNDVLFYNKWDFGVYDRVQWGEDDGPMISLGQSRLLSFSPNGSDGRYDVYGEFSGEFLTRCWVVIDDAIVDNGVPKYEVELVEKMELN